MSNFMKSVLYSTTVMAVGLVAIFAIYDNVTSQGGESFAEITPAAGGDNNIGINVEEVVGGAQDAIIDSASAMSGAVNDMAMEAGMAVNAIATDLQAIATEAGETIAIAKTNITPDEAKAAAGAPTDAVQAINKITETTNVADEVGTTVEITGEATTQIKDTAKTDAVVEIEPAANADGVADAVAAEVDVAVETKIETAIDAKSSAPEDKAVE